MANTNDMYHVCSRKTMKEINTIINRINKAVQASSYITRAALFSDCLGEIPLTDEYYHVGWTIGACEHAVLTIDKNRYNLYLPQPDWFDNECKKEKTMKPTYYCGNFQTSGDTYLCLNAAIELAESYGYVTMRDIWDFIGEPCSYNDTLLGWSESSIKKAEILGTPKYKGGYGYCIALPEYDWLSDAIAAKTFKKGSNANLCKKPEEKQDRSYSINFNIPVQSYAQDTDRFIGIIKEAFNKASEHKNSKVTINFS